MVGIQANPKLEGAKVSPKIQKTKKFAETKKSKIRRKKEAKKRRIKLFKSPVVRPTHGYIPGMSPLWRPVREWGQIMAGAIPGTLHGGLLQTGHVVAILRLHDKPLTKDQLWDRLKAVPESQILTRTRLKQLVNDLLDRQRISSIPHPEYLKTRSRAFLQMYTWRQERQANHFAIPDYLKERMKQYAENLASQPFLLNIITAKKKMEIKNRLPT